MDDSKAALLDSKAVITVINKTNHYCIIIITLYAEILNPKTGSLSARPNPDFFPFLWDGSGEVASKLAIRSEGPHLTFLGF